MLRCEVLDDGRWLPGQVLQWRRDLDGWRALVSYTGPLRRVIFPAGDIRHDTGEQCPVTYLHWRPATEVRPA